MKNQRRVCLWSSLLLLAFAAPTIAGEGVFEHPSFDNGDAEGELTAILASIVEHPLDPNVPVLLAELREIWDLVDSGKKRCTTELEKALSAAKAHWNGDMLRSVLAALHWSCGDPKRAEALIGERGFIDEYLVCGPFGVTRSAALSRPFAPEIAANEKTFDPRESFQGLREALGWRVAQRRPLRSSISTRGLLTGSGSVNYAVTHVRFDAPREGFLVYRGPSAKIWVNRALVGIIDHDGERLDSIVRMPVSLRTDWNRVLIKFGGGAGASFSLRLTDAAGAPLPPATTSSAPLPVAVGVAMDEAPYSSWSLEMLAREHDPQRRALYAWALLVADQGEEATTVLEDLAHSDPEVREKPWYLLLYASAVERSDNLPVAVRRERARQASREALALQPKSVRARQRLARFLASESKNTEAIVLLEAILAEAPGDLRTRLQLVQTLQGEGWNLEAERELEAAAQHGGAGTVALLRAQIQSLGRRGQRDAAQALREQLLERDPGQLWVILQRVDLALARGDGAAALAALAEYERRSQLTVDELADRRAGTLASLGDRAGQLEALRAGCEARPWDVARRLSLAQRLAEDAASDPQAAEEAKALLDAILAERPELRVARSLREGLADSEDRFWEEWTPNMKEVLAGAPDRAHWPKASTVCLFDQQVTKIYPDTSSVDVVHQIWRLLDDSGIERYGQRPQNGELLQIRTITPSGETLEPIRAGGGAFQMPGLTSGAVVEHAFKMAAGAARFQYTNGGFYFQDPDLTEPFWLSRWVLIIHRDAPVRLVERNMRRKGITKTVEERGDWIVTTYVARNQPRIQPEPNAPNRDEFLPWVKVVEERTLDEVGAFYRERGTGQAVTPSVARKAAELVFGLETTEERARALYAFCQEHVTGASGGVDAASILAARGGSKTTLLLGLLSAAGVPHHLLLAAPEPNDDVDWDHPEPGAFNVPLIRINVEKGEPLYVFPEAHRLAPFGRLPNVLWEAPAYVCDPAGGMLTVLPGEPFGAARGRSSRELVLQEDGSVWARVHKQLPSFSFYRLKELFGTLPKNQVRGWFAQQANRVFPGARLLESDVPGRDEVGVPFAVDFTIYAEGVIRERGDGKLELRQVLEPTQLKQRYGAHRLRVFPLILDDLWASGGQSTDEVLITLGPYACPRPPQGSTIKNRFGQFSLSYVQEDGRLRIERNVMLRPGRVQPRDYPAFRRFLEEIDQAERASILLERRER